MTRQQRLTVVTMVLAVAWIAVGIVGQVARPTLALGAETAVGALVAAVCLALALLISRREPQNNIAPVMGFAGAVFACITGVESYAGAASSRPDVLPLSDIGVAFTQGSWMLLYLPFALLLVLFPTGSPQGSRSRKTAVALPLVVALFVLCAALAEGPLADRLRGGPLSDVVGVSQVVGFAMLPVFMALLVASGWSVRNRYRVSDNDTRRQLRWLLLASALLPGTLLLCWASYLLLGDAELAPIGLVAMYVGIPAAATVGLLRSEAFDVDRAVVSSAVYSVVAALLLAVFAVTSGVVGAIAGPGSSILASGIAAGCVLALNPVRRRLQRWLGGWLYPARERGLVAVESLRRRIHAGTSEPEELEAVLRVALRDVDLRVGYAVPGTPGMVDATGTAVVPSARATAVNLAGEEIGVLVPGSPSTPRMPSELADEVATLVEMVRLRLTLARSVAEVGASRERLVRASIEERHRLERDLHDGAQQRLVSLGMSLRLTQRHLPAGADQVSEVLDAAVAELGRAVAELRELAHGIRPSSLDDGLAAALGSLCRSSPLPIDLELRGEDLPDVVSTTAYFVATEAVANAVKYSDADRIGLSVDHGPDEVRVQVVDDGRGGAVVRPGSGLAGITDRVQAIGGRLQVASPVGGGTVVEAVLPCAS